MERLTIGAFAQASRLSAKALRLYDELGLLRPACVDPVSGYRLYDPAQLDRARLVAWLRRLGMPLARIRVVGDLPPEAAAAEVAAYWAQVEADVAERRDLAAVLIDHLSGGESTMPDTHSVIRYAMRTDTGLVRDGNEDAVYAGARLLAVADGFGAAGGPPASTAAIDALRSLDTDVPAGDLLDALHRAVEQADDALHTIVESEPSRRDYGTTLTALLWSGPRLALAHIGDSRAYLLRDGELFQLTTDHTLVQSMVDEGRLSADEAMSHPQRAMLLRALQGAGGAEADIQVRDVRTGDRYLLCSDGLYAVVPSATVYRILSTVRDPHTAVGRLVAEAIACGGPDNVTCVVADVTETLVPAGDGPASRTDD